VYQLEEYYPQQAFDRDLPAAATPRPVVIWEGHTTKSGATRARGGDDTSPAGLFPIGGAAINIPAPE
jgi:hypothetical protein